MNHARTSSGQALTLLLPFAIVTIVSGLITLAGLIAFRLAMPHLIARMGGYKFVRTQLPEGYVPEGPDYFWIYHGGQMQTDGDDLAADDQVLDLPEAGTMHRTLHVTERAMLDGIRVVGFFEDGPALMMRPDKYRAVNPGARRVVFGTGVDGGLLGRNRIALWPLGLL